MLSQQQQTHDDSSSRSPVYASDLASSASTGSDAPVAMTSSSEPQATPVKPSKQSHTPSEKLHTPELPQYAYLLSPSIVGVGVGVGGRGRR